MADGAEIVNEARRWIGTPYRHQAGRLGAGCDCLGLVLGVWDSIGGAGVGTLPPYTADWFDPNGGERLLDALRCHLRPVEVARSGDVLLFRMRQNSGAKHLGILAESGPAPSFIHAYCGRGVVESPLSAPWLRRIAARFAFPER